MVLETGQLHINVIRTFFDTIHKMNLKWIKEVNVSLDIIKLLEENRENTLM